MADKKAPKPHRHRWTEATGISTGCGAEWFYECGCGATKYVCTDQGETTTEITEGTPPPRCQWFARCNNAATGTTPHPVLGDVPTCDRCADFVKGGN